MGARVIAHRIEQAAIDRHAPDIADGRRADQRQDQVRAFGHAPFGQGRGKVGLARGQVHLARRIEETEEADRAVDDEATGSLQGILDFTLQCIIGDRDRHAHVVEEIAQDPARIRAGHLAIGDGRRANHGAVDLVVESIDFSVELLPRIIGSRLGDRAAGKEQHEGDQHAAAKRGEINELQHFQGLPCCSARGQPRWHRPRLATCARKRIVHACGESPQSLVCTAQLRPATMAAKPVPYRFPMRLVQDGAYYC